MRQTTIILLLFFLVYECSFAHVIPDLASSPTLSDQSDYKRIIAKADSLQRTQHFAEAITVYEKALNDFNLESTPVLKKIALCYAAQDNVDKALEFSENYLRMEFNPEFLKHDGFSTISSDTKFIAIINKYTPKFTLWTFLYLYVALIGFYITLVINLNNKIDLPARLLISSFVFIHSFFILHICINLTLSLIHI